METVATAGVPEVIMDTGIISPSIPVPVTFSGKWEDFGKDMAAIAAEQGEVKPAQPESAPAVVTLPPPQTKAIEQQAQPVVPVVEAKPADVPDKFKAPDGTLDQEKLLKSYFEAEKSLKRAQNAAQVTPQPAQTQPVAPQPVQQAGVSQFEAQVAQDLINESAAQGVQLDPRIAVAQAKVQIRLMDAKHKADVAATFSEVAQFRESLAQQQQRSELEGLAKRNPWVLSPTGQAELVKIREEKPWLNSSPTPWADAVEILLGRKNQAPGGPVNMPIPSGVQQTAKPLPVTPAPTAQTPISLNTPAEVEAYVKTLSPQQEAEFWKRMGLKWDAPKQFSGLY